MSQDTDLKSKYGQDPGFRVPEGYFEELNLAIMEKLPPMAETPKTAPLTSWQRFKPYIYLAAMFAGIWLMMNMFHHISNTPLNIDNLPENIVLAMSDQPDYDNYAPYESDYSVEQEISSQYSSLDDFQKDFGYELKPEYAGLIM